MGSFCGLSEAVDFGEFDVDEGANVARLGPRDENEAFHGEVARHGVADDAAEIAFGRNKGHGGDLFVFFGDCIAHHFARLPQGLGVLGGDGRLRGGGGLRRGDGGGGCSGSGRLSRGLSG